MLPRLTSLRLVVVPHTRVHFVVENSANGLDATRRFGPEDPVQGFVRSHRRVLLSSIAAKLELQRVKTFVVVPVKVGTSVFGTLSFGCACLYEFSSLQVAGFEMLANAIGTSVTNFRNAIKVHEIFVNNARLSVSVTGLEVAQSARHEARTSIERCTDNIATLQALIRKPKENVDALSRKLQELDANIHSIQEAMNKIREASKLPTEELTMGSINELWREAIALVAGRMAELDVRPLFQGKDISIELYPQRLRHAFLNLLLNSMDAFKDRRVKSSRTITVSVDPRSPEASDMRIRYADNAIGIDPTKLSVPADVDSSKPLKDLIFEAGVTSTPTGSGYGLYLVRRMVAEHSGSIDLVDYRGGVVFDIVLPKRQTVAAIDRRDKGKE